MSERFNNRELPSTFRRGPVATISSGAVLNTAFDGEPHFADENLLYVYDESSNTMIPVGHVPGVSGSFTVDGVVFTITNGLITNIA